MNRFLKPSRLDLGSSSTTAAKEWKHWHRTVSNFIEECGEEAPDKFRTLINYVSPNVYDYIEDCHNYESAVEILHNLYVKAPNEVFARHLLATRCQQPGESIHEFLHELRKLSKDCNLKAVTAEQHRELLLRDSFINGLLSPLIRQRLLENKTLDLQTAYDQAKSLDLAQTNSEAYTLSSGNSAATITTPPPNSINNEDQHTSEETEHYAHAATYKRCYFCGGSVHNRRMCPAREALCNKCNKKGHFAKVCKSKGNPSHTSTTAALFSPTICAMNAYPSSLSHAVINVHINGCSLSALVDSYSSDSFISEKAANKLKLEVRASNQNIYMAQTTMNTKISGYCVTDIIHNGQHYTGTRLALLKDLCSDVILGYDFQKQHSRLTFELGGSGPELNVNSTSTCALSAATVDEPSLFDNLLPNAKPIATKSRYFNKDDRDFIQSEVDRLTPEDIIEPSTSPWRAQVVVLKNSEKG
ncbi:uncharacterized protein LOC121381668 [Gigantopelta aegis]|uniref:uncharacterized protein LOC121381668 n=1 Tax=Gigantopelta aegis TaxID=1735272 RepID=UPI001B88D4C0|nr:uncharacterized protein LOC121381668 [Gigantopelta aegis]